MRQTAGSPHSNLVRAGGERDCAYRRRFAPTLAFGPARALLVGVIPCTMPRLSESWSREDFPRDPHSDPLLTWRKDSCRWGRRDMGPDLLLLGLWQEGNGEH